MTAKNIANHIRNSISSAPLSVTLPSPPANITHSYESLLQFFFSFYSNQNDTLARFEEYAITTFYSPLVILEHMPIIGGELLVMFLIAFVHGMAHGFLQLAWAFVRYPAHYVHHLLLLGASYTIVRFSICLIINDFC